MTRSQQEYVIQQLIDTCGDITQKGIAETIGESVTMIRCFYHGIGQRSLTIGMEKRLREMIDKKIRNLIKIIQFIDKHN